MKRCTFLAKKMSQQNIDSLESTIGKSSSGDAWQPAVVNYPSTYMLRRYQQESRLWRAWLRAKASSFTFSVNDLTDIVVLICLLLLSRDSSFKFFLNVTTSPIVYCRINLDTLWALRSKDNFDCRATDVCNCVVKFPSLLRFADAVHRNVAGDTMCFQEYWHTKVFSFLGRYQFSIS
jgi:hypothetical protein